MNFTVFFIGSLTVLIGFLILSFVLANVRFKAKRLLRPIDTMCMGIFCASFLLFIPIYGMYYPESDSNVIKTLLMSLHNAIRLFAIDSDFDIIKEAVLGLEPSIRHIYSFYATVLFVSAPIMTFSIILSFFKGVSAYCRYLSGYFRPAYIFSELNEKSLSLADSIKKNNKRAVIVFTDVFVNNEEQSCELAGRAGEIGAVCFKTDINSVNFKIHKGSLSFFTISDDEEENISRALKLIKEFRSRKNSNLYLFSTRIESEVLLSMADKGALKVRRINDVRALISRTLYEDGKKFFELALPSGEEKVISAVIVGMGKHGSEMLRALSWFCQMDGYRVKINAFDKDPLAKSKFTAQCPELMSDKYNGVYVEGEAEFLIKIHSGIDIDTNEFSEAISKITDATYILVSLGNDADNIRAAVMLRMLCERIKIKPRIQAIVYSSDEKAALDGMKNFKGQKYNIEFIGDIRSSYSESVIINSELEERALQSHLKWGKEEDFWAYEYNYRSSVASAIHKKTRVSLGIKGAEKRTEELTPEERRAIETLEHKRWNAYMRSEGYVYSGSKDKSSRNDIGKMHHDLVCYDDLSEEEKRKDSEVGAD